MPPSPLCSLTLNPAAATPSNLPVLFAAVNPLPPRSLAKLSYRPPVSSLQQMSEASLALMRRSSAHDLSLTCYSFAVLGFKPPEAWWLGFWEASGARMGQASSQGLANMFWALGRLKKVGEGVWA